MTHQFSSWFKLKINSRCATIKDMKLFHDQNKFGLRNTLQAIFRYSEKKKTQLTINLEYFKRSQIFRKRPRDIRQWV